MCVFFRNFWCHIDVILDKICLNYVRTDDFMPSSHEKCVPSQDNM